MDIFASMPTDYRDCPHLDDVEFSRLYATSSMRNMGLSALYLSPYLEQVQQTGKGANFSLTVFGLAFVFESTL
jgi:hypothetical protein